MEQIDNIKNLIIGLETKLTNLKNEHNITSKTIIEKIKNGDIIRRSNIPENFEDDYDINLIFLIKRQVFLNKKYASDKDFFIDYAKKLPKPQNFDYQIFDEIIFSCPKLFKEVIKYRPGCYLSLRKNLKNNRNYNLELIKCGCNIFHYMKKEFKEDKEFLNSYLEMVAKSKEEFYFPELTNEFKNDKNIIKNLLILINKGNLVDIKDGNFIGDKLMKNSMFLYECIFINSDYIKNIPLEEFLPISETKMFAHMIKKLKELK